MKRHSLILMGLLIVLFGGWYLLQRAERSDLSVPELRGMFLVDSTTVDSIAFKYATWTHLSKGSDQTWRVQMPGWSHPASGEMIASMFRATTEMVLENLIATKRAKHQKFQVDTVAGAILEFFEAGQPVSRMVLGKRGGGFGHTYVRRLESDSVYEARGDLLQIFRRPPSDWMSKAVFGFDSTTVLRVRWSEGAEETILERTADRTWQVRQSGAREGVPVDAGLVAVRLGKLCPLTADALQPYPSAISPHFENPGSQVIIEVFDGRTDTLLFNPIDEEQGGRIYAFRPGRDKPIFIFFQSSYDRFFGRYDELVKTDTTETGL